MADPLKIIRRLDVVTTDYAVFERDQVLTHEQLNSVGEYLDDQGRLTRTQLLGVGIVGGLRPLVGKGEIVVGKGVGVTTDGDLLGLAVDRVFNQFLPYDESAPAYESFYVDGKIIPLLELLPADASDKRQGKPLAEIGDRLKEMVLLVFMESYENDPDLCTGGDCDNRGRRAHNTQRMLLIDREMAVKIGLTATFATGTDLARRLPRLRASRVDLGTGADAKVDVTSAELFAARYRNAASTSFKSLQAAVGELVKRVGDGFALDLPSPASWQANLGKRVDALANTVAGIQYLHAHAKDLIAVWNDLRAALFADDGVLCPATGAFPKHLLLGALADPAVDRTGCYPAPWLAGGNSERQRVIRLMEKFGLLLDSFELPKAQTIKITPSRRESVALEERAIPIYYKADGTLRELWNDTRRQRGESEDNTGYFWTPEPGRLTPPNQPVLADPFLIDQGSCDFYRIEGCLGLKADVAEVAIEKLIRQRNLPIAVISALAHNERRLIIRGPLFKKTSLHSLHYLLRQDVASHLKDNIAYSDLLVKRFEVDKAWVPVQTGKPSPTETVTAAKQELLKADSKLIGVGKPLSARTFKGFQSVATAWTEPLTTASLNTAKARTSIGDIVRTDVMSPVDTLSVSKTHIWVDWLGDILKKREDDQKDRLLLTNMLNEHPGLEHAGGAVPGGTFVLVYNDAGVVIGDLMLPYWIDDNDESDFDEPELTLPDIRFRLPDDFVPIKVIKPLQFDLAEFKAREITPEINIQTNYSKFFKESLGSLGDVLRNTSAPTLGGTRFDSGDDLLNQLLAEIDGKKNQVDGLREMVADDRLPVKTREAVEAQIKRVEGELGNLVKDTTEHFAVTAPETVRTGTAAVKVYATINQGISAVGNQTITTKLRTDLAGQAGGMTGSSAQVITHIMNTGFGGF